MTTTITVCETCKCAGWDAEKDPQTDGEKLAELIEKAAQGSPDVTVRRHACLMGCDFACNIAIQADEKLNYVLGKFEPTADDADGIVAYATLHANSEKGQVPYREWPQAIKGHFRARLPVLDGE
jgi:predicted metal-binding protein